MKARWGVVGALAAAAAGIAVDRLVVRPLTSSSPASGASPSPTATVTHRDGTVTAVPVALGGVEPWRHMAAATVRVRDDGGAPIPARLTFVGDHGTPSPAFTTTDIGREERGAVLAFDRAFVLRGDALVHVPAGRYRVYVGHGPEWDVAEVPLAVAQGGEGDVDAVLHHVVDTPGWISADLHVHAAASYDSKVPMRDRVHQFVADGVDLIGSTRLIRRRQEHGDARSDPPGASPPRYHTVGIGRLGRPRDPGLQSRGPSRKMALGGGTSASSLEGAACQSPST